MGFSSFLPGIGPLGCSKQPEGASLDSFLLEANTLKSTFHTYAAPPLGMLHEWVKWKLFDKAPDISNLKPCIIIMICYP
jgi:hypothetical protein